MYVQPEMRRCVCFVCANIGGQLTPVGTAFFLAVAKPPVQYVVVVTALHVLANVQKQAADGTNFVNSDDGKTFLRVNTKDGGFKVVEVTEDQWFKPDMSEEIVDIAFCPWQELPSASEFDFLSVGTDLAATKDVMESKQIGLGSELAFAGLFVNHHGRKRNEPIVRFGNISGIPAEPSPRESATSRHTWSSHGRWEASVDHPFSWTSEYWIVDNVRQERSGGNLVYLLGVVNAHFDVFVENATTGDRALDEHVNKGIAVVTPIDKVLRVIERSRFGRLIVAASEAAKQKFTEMDPTELAQILAQGHTLKMELPVPDDDEAQEEG
ncbi:hypothetical protein [Mycobacterium intracellulare]|uniref:hypothetical protein n=1 Tax=Mycobacterium intracellulare TaxID=1767 RepID=UPI0012BC14B3|nr:hypothetical protein [Mycobacterium intracellulare]